MTVDPYGPDALGCTRVTVAGTEGPDPARGRQSQKAGRGSDRSLQPDCVKPESLVTAGQLNGGEYVPRRRSHCQPRPPRWCPIEGGRMGRAQKPAQTGVAAGDARGARTPYRKVRHGTITTIDSLFCTPSPSHPEVPAP